MYVIHLFILKYSITHLLMLTNRMSLNDSFDDSSVGFNSLAIIDSYIKESTQMMSFDEAMRDMPAEGIDEYLNTRDGYISDRVGSDNNSIGNQVYSNISSLHIRNIYTDILLIYCSQYYTILKRNYYLHWNPK